MRHKPIPRGVFVALLLLTAGSVACHPPSTKRTAASPPNILFAISDDQSWLHAGAYGDQLVQTPAFDRVARDGVLFSHAFTATPSCTPSRSAILTGQAIWRLEQGGLLFGTLPEKLPVFPLRLEEAGFFIGYTGKGWSPGDFRAGGRTRDPLGPAYNDARVDSPIDGISPIDYAANFDEFLDSKPKERPFFFWFGASEPHLPYSQGAGLKKGKDIEAVQVPDFLPDATEVRGDFLDYYAEIEWFDRHLGTMLQLLEQTGELDNTLIIVTSDNGMPLPRSKTTLYDWGVRMPLAISWPRRIPGKRKVEDFVSHPDFAPTLLELAGVEVPAEMTGRSLLPILFSEREGRVEAGRNRVFTAIERHTWCRPGGRPYPSRAIRTYEYLYIRNYEPDRWPAGDPDFDSPHQGFYGDVDRSPTKSFMLERAHQTSFPREFEWGFGKRPAEELFKIEGDPYQIVNLAEDPQYSEIKQSLRRQLDEHLIQSEDPRARGESPWDSYRYYFRDYANR